MTQALQLGPLSFPVSLLLALAAMFLGGAGGQVLARRRGADAEAPLFRLVVAALVAARLAFVAQAHETYLARPLDILDIRDGGWSAWAGIAAAAALAVWYAARRAPLRLPLGVALGTAVVIWVAGTALLEASQARDPMPAVELTDLDGRPVLLSAFAGKPTVVNLWATWCPPCRREMPVLQEAQAARPDVNFVFVNQGDSAAKVQFYLSREQLPLANVLLDVHWAVARETGHRSLPTTLFYDARGRLVDTRIGEVSRATLAQRLPPHGPLFDTGVQQPPRADPAPAR